MDEHGRIAAIIEDHVGNAAALPVEELRGEIPVFFQRLAL